MNYEQSYNRRLCLKMFSICPCHPELVEGSIFFNKMFRQAQHDNSLYKEQFAKLNLFAIASKQYKIKQKQNPTIRL